MAPQARRATGGFAARAVGDGAVSKVACAAAIGLTALGTMLLVASARAGVRPNFENYGVDAALALTFPVVGTLVVARQPRNPVGWLFISCGLLSSVVVMSEQYARYGLVSRPGTLPGALVAASVQSWLWLPAVVPVPTFLFLLFPDGRLISRRWRIPAWAALAALLTGTLCLALLDQHLDLIGPKVTNVFGVASLEPLIRHLFPLAMLVFFGASMASVAALVVRLRRADGLLRRQLGLVSAAALLLVAELFLNNFLPPSLAVVLQPVAFALVPVAAGVAMVRYQLYGFELVLNRTLVYVALSGFVIGSYVVTVGLVVHFFPTMDTEGSLLATGLVAIGFQPLRHRLQLGVDRLMYGERHDPYAVLSLLGRRLEASVAPGDAAGIVVDTVASALRLSYAAVELMGDDGPVMVAARGRPSDDIEALAVSDHGVIVGRLLLSPRSGGPPLDDRDRRLLGDLARHAGAAVHAAGLAQELQRSREGLVTAREEERRRLRRDLHDGLGPALAGVVLGLDTARNMVAQPTVDAFLLELRGQTQDAVAEIRRLVYDLRPPALDDLGLLGALREQAARLSPPRQQAGLVIEVSGPSSLVELPAAVEVAAYRIVGEALANTVRHADATRCDVRLRFDRGLEIEICDDGSGIAGHRRGLGLASMAERAAELGGTFRIESSTTGTAVHAVLPVAVGPAGPRGPNGVNR